MPDDSATKNGLYFRNPTMSRIDGILSDQKAGANRKENLLLS